MSRNIESLQNQITELEAELVKAQADQRAAILRLDTATARMHTQHVISLKSRIARRKGWLAELQGDRDE